MAAPLTPTWDRPSHPDIQDVIINEAEFTSKSLSKAAIPPFGLFAKMSFPPCTLADRPTYATVQFGRDKHLNLNSDLLYINHSCEPSLIFDTTNLNVLAGPKGLKPGDELTFFYPSTEWDMAQPFDCLCGKPPCRGRISGAKDMTDAQLEGVWLNGHIRELLEEQKAATAKYGYCPASVELQQGSLVNSHMPEDSNSVNKDTTLSSTSADRHADPTTQALKDALQQAEKVVVRAWAALLSYAQTVRNAGFRVVGNASASNVQGSESAGGSHKKTGYEANGLSSLGSVNGSQRRGPTSRELSGEMGGDTICA